jgi:flagellar biosynthetic protein FliO
MGGTNTLMLFVRLIFSLAIVMGLMWAAASMLRRRGMGGLAKSRTPRGADIELLSRRHMGRNASIAVVRVGEKAMVVGVTDQRITKLDDAEVDEIDLNEGANWTAPNGARPSPGTAWKAMLDQLRNRTVRH